LFASIHILLLTWLIVSYFILLFMTCLSIVMVLHYLYMAAVSTLFSFVVLLITYCVVKLHFIRLFEQIKKEERKRKTCTELTQLHDALLVTRVSVTKLIGCRAAVRAPQFANYSSAQRSAVRLLWTRFEVTGQVACMPGGRQASSPTRTFTSPTSQPADKSTRHRRSQVAEI